MKKLYVLDTNVLIHDHDALMSFEDNDVIIPMIVIEELDGLKKSQDIGHIARHVSRQLDALREKGCLSTGVQLFPGGGMLKVQSLADGYIDTMPMELRNTKICDNVIITTTKWLIEDRKSRGEVDPCILVSKDVNVRVKCDAVGIPCQDYFHTRVTSNKAQFYKGVEVFDDPKWKPLIDQIYAFQSPASDAVGAPIGVSVPHELSSDKIVYSNEILVIKDSMQASVVVRVIEDKGSFFLTRIPEYSNVMGLKPRNKEQSFALSLLLDPEIKLVTLSGCAGTGKTLISIASGLDQLKGLGEHPIYDRVIVTRPVQTVGKDLGYLPGTLQEKMDPWITPIKDNLNFLVGYKNSSTVKRMKSDTTQHNDVEPYLAMLMKDGKIEVEAIPYIRGRSIPRAFLIIDEAQNLSPHELKTIITRSGEGTKIVLTGDIEQIDRQYVDIYTNGLSHCIEKFKDHSIAGHMTLTKGERSALATLASRIL